MKITRAKLRQLIKEMSDPAQDAGPDYLSKIKVMLDRDPTLENINQMHLLADSIDIDMEIFQKIAYPAFKKAVESYVNVSIDEVKSFYELGNNIGFNLEQMKSVMSPVILKSVQSYSKPTLKDIKVLHNLAKSMSLELDLESIVLRMTKKSNVLEQISVDNIIYEIDDILFRARDEGLKSMGIQGVAALERGGIISEDNVYDTDMELIYSVKSMAIEAIERSISQIILEVLK